MRGCEGLRLGARVASDLRLTLLSAVNAAASSLNASSARHPRVGIARNWRSKPVLLTCPVVRGEPGKPRVLLGFL